MSSNERFERMNRSFELRRFLLSLLSVIAIVVVSGFLLVNFQYWFAIGQLGHRGRTPCKNNLHLIGLALHNYADAYGSFPPAYVAGKDGRRMHSWRVLILPQLEEGALYKQYRFDEPWDGPHNRTLADKMPEIYRCDTDVSPNKAHTSYAAIVGANTAWPGEKCVTFRDMTDGSSNSLLVVEAAGAGIHWMEPRDLDYDEIALRINPESSYGIASEHQGGANVLLGDGAVRFLGDAISEETVRRLIEIDDGEEVGEF